MFFNMDLDAYSQCISACYWSDKLMKSIHFVEGPTEFLGKIVLCRKLSKKKSFDTDQPARIAESDLGR